MDNVIPFWKESKLKGVELKNLTLIEALDVATINKYFELNDCAIYEDVEENWWLIYKDPDAERLTLLFERFESLEELKEQMEV